MQLCRKKRTTFGPAFERLLTCTFLYARHLSLFIRAWLRQHHHEALSFSNESDCLNVRFLFQECSDKDKIISSLKEDNERSSSTLANYKHQIDNLQEAIVEHQNKQKEIEAQMKAETEANAGKY